MVIYFTTTDKLSIFPPTPFDDGVSPFKITTPIYYVNNKPRIGHTYTRVTCNVIARYMCCSGWVVYFLSGANEHGQKVKAMARRQGCSRRSSATTCHGPSGKS
jgi:methionyl-tRNA synthetase